MNERIIHLIEEGQFLVAIKLYKDQNHVSFVTAKETIYDLKNSVKKSYRPEHSSDTAYDFNTVENRTKIYLYEGRRNEAIRFYRKNMNVDVNEANQMIKEIERKIF